MAKSEAPDGAADGQATGRAPDPVSETAHTIRRLEEARTRVQGRITEAVAALEYLRLNMLRLASGSGSEEDFTVDLSRARRLSGELDDLARGEAEVRRLLAEEGP